MGSGYEFNAIYSTKWKYIQTRTLGSLKIGAYFEPLLYKSNTDICSQICADYGLVGYELI